MYLIFWGKEFPSRLYFYLIKCKAPITAYWPCKQQSIENNNKKGFSLKGYMNGKPSTCYQCLIYEDYLMTAYLLHV